MSHNTSLREIRLDVIFSTIWRHKRKFYLPVGLTAVLSYALICCVPRYYSVKVMLAPEYDTGISAGMSGISSLAGLAGVDLGALGSSSDALVPTFYPDLMESTDFIVPLLGVEVSTQDKSFTGTYFDYLTKHQDAAWWDKAINYIKAKLSSDGGGASGVKQLDPFRLTKRESLLMKVVMANIRCEVDKKTDVISISTTAQDPLVAAQLANAVKEKLQDFITDYRTRKARNELEYVKKICRSAYADYQEKQKAYAAFSDAHNDLVLTEYRVKGESLENELQLAYNAYSSAKVQETVAQSKVLSRTPAFTTLQNATVPVRPAGPKRVVFTVIMMFFCFMATSAYVLHKYRTGPLLGRSDEEEACKTETGSAESAGDVAVENFRDTE